MSQCGVVSFSCRGFIAVASTGVLDIRSSLNPLYSSCNKSSVDTLTSGSGAGAKLISYTDTVFTLPYGNRVHIQDYLQLAQLIPPKGRICLADCGQWFLSKTGPDRESQVGTEYLSCRKMTE